MKQKVLFLCTHNSARSQMAEGLLNKFHGETYADYSAGIHPTKLNQHVVKVLGEIGIDISTQRSKSVEEFREENFEYVVTVRDDTKKDVSLFSGRKKSP